MTILLFVCVLCLLQLIYCGHHYQTAKRCCAPEQWEAEIEGAGAAAKESYEENKVTISILIVFMFQLNVFMSLKLGNSRSLNIACNILQLKIRFSFDWPHKRWSLWRIHPSNDTEHLKLIYDHKQVKYTTCTIKYLYI